MDVDILSNYVKFMYYVILILFLLFLSLSLYDSEHIYCLIIDKKISLLSYFI